MGQYFAPANLDKHEFICPWCIGSGAKLWEWAANSQGAILTLLLRCNSEPITSTLSMSVPTLEPSNSLTPLSHSNQLPDGQANLPDENQIIGRWACDRVMMVGDSDSSELWLEIYKGDTYRNISPQLVSTWNAFIELSDLQLSLDSSCHCGTKTR